MAKEILLYTSINSYSVSDFINSLEANKGDDISIRMNTPGGSVYDGYGAIAKFNEFPNNKKLKIDGKADSFGAYFMCHVPTEDVECLDVSTFTFHRAAMPAWFEANAEYFTDEVKAQLTTINASLRASIEGKVTAEKWKQVTKTSLDDVFSLSSRIDVRINAEQAKKMGMVGTITKITPKKLAEIKAYSLDLAAELTTHIQTENTEAMTINDVRANTEVYNALKAEILGADKIRVKAFAAWEKYDPKAVLAHIVNGDEYNEAVAAGLQVKALSATGTANIAAANAPEVNTPEAPAAQATDAEKAEAEAAAELKEINAGIISRFGGTTQA